MMSRLSHTAEQIAQQVDGVVDGYALTAVHGVAGLREAQAGDISFLANRKYAPLVAKTQASVVLVARDFDGPHGSTLIRVGNPDAAFAKVAMLFAAPSPVYTPGRHASAVISDEAVIGEGVHIGPHCVVEAGARIGDQTVLVASCYVGGDACLGENVLVYPNVTIREGSEIGNRVIIHSSAVIGSDGFGYSVDEQGVRTKVPQIGIVSIGDDAEIGAATTIDRARFGRTVIGKGAKIDNLVQIAHNVVIGDHAVIVSQVGISGSTVIGKHAILAGQVGVAGHLVIGDRVVAEGRAGITKDIPAGQMIYGFPAAPREQAARLHAHVQRLPKLKKKVSDLEARIQALESGGAKES